MSPPIRTLAFLIAAGLSIGIAWQTKKSYEPVDLDDFSDVGELFYPEFDNPNQATGLQVASYNDETGKTDLFKVEFKDGLWRIPSHHNYPADAEDRLSQTAASIVGVPRQALVERTKAAHKRYDLIDPLDRDVSGTEGRGDRITLYEGDETLVDFIIGRKVDEQGNNYYIRKADEDRFYTADLGSVEISTSFADWIATDVLDVSRNDIRELMIDRYQVDEARGTIVEGDRMLLTRESSTADWNLSDLDEAKEQLKTSDINSMLTALDDLAIVGVRPKPEGISADLKAAEGISVDTFDMIDLQNRGFFIDPRRGRILSNEGELGVSTANGVVYSLRFGEEFSGTDIELEVGQQADGESADSADEDSATKADADTVKTDENESESPDETDNEDDGLKKSRYLFVTVQFDQDLLGPAPVAPVKPEPPAEQSDAEATDAADTPDEETSAEETAEETDVQADTQNSDEQPENNDDVAADSAADASDEAAADPSAETEPAEQPDPQKEYEVALARYEEEQEVYKIQLGDYEQKVKEGQDRVDELNRRFADWFYVISADVFDRFKLNRDDLVEAKEAEEAADAEATTEDHPLLDATAPAAEEMKDEPETTEPAEDANPSADSPEETSEENDAANVDKTPASEEKATEETSTEEKTSESSEEQQDGAVETETSKSPVESEPAASSETTTETAETDGTADPSPEENEST